MQSGRITLALYPWEAAGLQELAEQECRSPHDELRYLLRAALVARNLAPIPAHPRPTAEPSIPAPACERK